MHTSRHIQRSLHRCCQPILAEFLTLKSVTANLPPVVWAHKSANYKNLPFHSKEWRVQNVKKKLHRLGRLNSLDPYYQDDLPVNEYVDPTNDKSLSRVYVWGSAVHGALGNPSFVFGKYAGKKKVKFMEPKDMFYNPVRCGGAEQYRIKDAAGMATNSFLFCLLMVKCIIVTVKILQQNHSIAFSSVLLLKLQ